MSHSPDIVPTNPVINLQTRIYVATTLVTMAIMLLCNVFVDRPTEGDQTDSLVRDAILLSVAVLMTLTSLVFFYRHVTRASWRKETGSDTLHLAHVVPTLTNFVALTWTVGFTSGMILPFLIGTALGIVGFAMALQRNIDEAVPGKLMTVLGMAHILLVVTALL